MNIETLIADVQHRFGHQALKRASNMIIERETLSTGIATLDAMLEGGLLKGATHSLSGKPTSGATSLVYQIVASIQKQKIPVVYLDMANLFDVPNAVSMGIQTEDLLLAQSVSLKNTLFLIQTLAKHRIPCLLVVDTPDLLPLTQVKSALRKGLITLITLSTKPLLDMQVSLQCQHKSWRFEGEDVVSFTSDVRLCHHPFLSSGQIELSFAVPKEDERA